PPPTRQKGAWACGSGGVFFPRGGPPLNLEWHHGLRHDRRGCDVAEPWGALQWDIPPRGGLSHPEVQQGPAVGSRAERFDPVKYRDQGERAARSRMGFYLRSAGRVRSLFAASGQWPALGGSERRHTAHQPGLERRLEPGRAILQFRGLFGRQFTLWHLDRFPAKLADFGRCFGLRSDGRFVRFLADRLAGNYLRRGRYRGLPI